MSPARRSYVVGHDESGPITQERHDAEFAGSEVRQPTAADLGPTSGQVSAAAHADSDPVPQPVDADDPAPVDPDGEVPETAADVAAWIDAADDSGEATRRAQLAWDVEVARSGDPRKTVVDAVDPYLEDDDDSTS